MLVLLIYACLLARVTNASFLRMAFFYFLSGVSGNLFAELSMAENIGGIGASTAVYGIFGCLIGMMLLN
jgi:membrane associated rhomboid family serine protease